MGRFISLSLALFIGFLLSSNPSFAYMQGLEYSMPPHCDEHNEVTCENDEEKAVCLSDINDSEQYIPSCDGEEPKCVGKDNKFLEVHNVELNCLALAQCQDGKPHCANGRIARCFESSDEPQGCDCPNGPVVCEKTWQISNIGSYQ